MEVIKSLEQFQTYSTSITSLKAAVTQGIQTVQATIKQGVTTIQGFKKTLITPATDIV